MEFIGFNKPYMTGNELEYIRAAVSNKKISGDGEFTKKCHAFFETQYGFSKTLLTTSCTDALEMCAILLNIMPGDEVIVPSYTFVSTVNAFILRGANIVFVDSSAETPNMNVSLVEDLITSKTKAIIPVHYAGVACDMDPLLALANKYGIAIIEDAAQAIDSFYKGKPLGSLGAMSAFSFHETKNIISGEGGLFVSNDAKFNARAEIIREKGTNRSAFFRGEVDKYNWVDIGSSFLPSDMIAAFLFAQLEKLQDIQSKRKSIWKHYEKELSVLTDAHGVRLPFIPDYATNNAHMFYLVCNNIQERTTLIEHLKKDNIQAVFHYLSLHKSDFFKGKHDGRELKLADYYTDTLLRLPFYYELSEKDLKRITDSILNFFNAR